MTQGRAHWFLAAGAALVWTLVVFVPAESDLTPEVLGIPAPPSYGDQLDANTVVVRITVRQIHAAQGAEVELSRPTVSTLLGTRLSIEQTLRLRPGHEIDISLQAIARAVTGPKRAAESTLILEEDLRIHERRRTWRFWEVSARDLVRSQVVHYDADRRPHRVEFSIEGQLFAVDLEVVAHGEVQALGG